MGVISHHKFIEETIIIHLSNVKEKEVNNKKYQ
jgi:hypothetical protein